MKIKLCPKGPQRKGHLTKVREKGYKPSAAEWGKCLQEKRKVRSESLTAQEHHQLRSAIRREVKENQRRNAPHLLKGGSQSFQQALIMGRFIERGRGCCRRMIG